MRSVGGYELEGRVGSGTTGVVWKARDPALGRTVALKEVPAAAAATLRAEATRLATLDDPHVVSVFGFFEEDGSAYLIEEWVEGAPLSAVVAEHGPLSTEQALGVCRGALLGLTHAHRKGIVHGDVSASNVLVDTDGVSRLIDFGVGGSTPAYRSPEAAAARPLTPASDVYAAAALIAELLGTVDPRLAPVLEKARSADPSDRFPDAGALLAALEEAAEQAYGKRWWTEAGMAALVAPAVAGVVASSAGSSAAATAGTSKAGTVVTSKAFIASAAGAAVVAAGAAVYVVARDEPAPPVLVDFRTDGLCGAVEEVVQARAFGDVRIAEAHRFVQGQTMAELGFGNTTWTDPVTGTQGDTVTRLDGCEWSPKAPGATAPAPFTWVAVQVTSDEELIATWQETAENAADQGDQVACTDFPVEDSDAAWSCEVETDGTRAAHSHFQSEDAMMQCFVSAAADDHHSLARLEELIADVCPELLATVGVYEES